MPTAEGPDIPNIHSIHTHTRARMAVRAGAATHVPNAGLVISVFFNKRAAGNAAGPPVGATPSDDP